MNADQALHVLAFRSDFINHRLRFCDQFFFQTFFLYSINKIIYLIVYFTLKNLIKGKINKFENEFI